MRAVAVALVVLTACGRGDVADNTGARLPTAGSPSPSSSAEPSGSAAPAEGSASIDPRLPAAARSQETTFPLPDFVKAEVPEEEAWGDACFVPRAGSACKVPFEGVAYLATKDEANIALLAFENKSDTPAAVRLLPAEPGSNRLCFERGCPHGGAWLPYVPSATAETVTFVVELREPGGKVLAKSFPRTFPIS